MGIESGFLRKIRANQFQVVNSALNQIRIKRKGVQLTPIQEMQYNRLFGELSEYRDIKLKEALGVDLTHRETSIIKKIRDGDPMPFVF